jgi:hypothetical protein
MFILSCTFNGDCISEYDYHKIIELMRNMNINGKYNTLDEVHQKFIKDIYGIKEDYNPFDFMEKLRFAFIFGNSSNKIAEAINW